MRRPSDPPVGGLDSVRTGYWLGLLTLDEPDTAAGALASRSAANHLDTGLVDGVGNVFETIDYGPDFS